MDILRRTRQAWFGNGGRNSETPPLEKPFHKSPVVRQGPDARDALHEFEQLLDGSRLTAVYQPIVSLVGGHILGWEALARGPEGSAFRSPDALFGFAREVGLMWPLERACRRAALAGLGRLAPERKVFLNVNAHSINDPQFIQGETLHLIEGQHLDPHNVVFEITERTSIQDFDTFRRALQHYRNQGYLIAIDDVGAGYSSLQSIAELRPDFIKLDMSLVKGGANSVIKQAILEAFVTFAAKIGCTLIAEGIETRDELRILVDLGVEFGQGFYLARPAAPAPGVSEAVQRSILTLNRRPRYTASLHLPVEQLAGSVPTVTPDTPVREVIDRLKPEDGPDGLVVLEGTRPVGLVMRDRLFRQLGVPFGIALHYEQPLSSLMDQAPVVVEAGTSIEHVSRQVTARDARQRYDLIVVTEGGEYRGILSVHKLLHTLTEFQLTLARHANPLTGLPGNVTIHAELEQRLEGAEPCTVIYADLDRFKVYNDAHGFYKGDQVLLHMAHLLTHLVTKHGGKNTFVGHVGGDDFVAIVGCQYAGVVCHKLIACFNRTAPRFGPLPDAAPDTQPWLALSLAAVDISHGEYRDPAEVAAMAARLKREAKAETGSALRRRPGAPLPPAGAGAPHPRTGTRPGRAP